MHMRKYVMKKITRIEYQKNRKDRVNIYLDEDFACSIDLDNMIEHSLTKNMKLKEEFIDEILIAEEQIKVYNYGLRVLSRNPKSEKQLREKMNKKGFDLQFIDNAIFKLKKQKYLDDERYSEILIDSKLNSSLWGKCKVKDVLYKRGIDRNIIEKKLSTITEKDEIKRACYIGAKKLKTLTEDDTYKKASKLSNFLINRGFEYSTVRKTVSQLLASDCEEYCGFESY